MLLLIPYVYSISERSFTVKKNLWISNKKRTLKKGFLKREAISPIPGVFGVFPGDYVGFFVAVMQRLYFLKWNIASIICFVKGLCN